MICSIAIKTKEIIKTLDIQNIEIEEDLKQQIKQDKEYVCEVVKLSKNFVKKIKSKSSIKETTFKNVNIRSFMKSCDACIIETEIGKVIIEQSWYTRFEEIFNDCITKIIPKINKESGKSLIIPHSEKIFSWTFYTRYQDVTCVMLGQDPYQKIELATGVAMAVDTKQTNVIPHSLRVIYKKIQKQLGINMSIEEWTAKGNLYQLTKHVLLLNSGLTLSIEKDKYKSHINAWRQFTKSLLSELVMINKDINFVCLGFEAKKILDTIAADNIIYDEHPSSRTLSDSYFVSPVIFDHSYIEL